MFFKKHFDIYGGEDKSPEAIKDGWAWWAFIFVGLWALYHKLWWYAGGMVAVGWGVSLLIEQLDARWAMSVNSVYGMFGLFIGMVFGIWGNEWRRENLLRRGYRLLGSVEAPDGDTAIGRFRKSQPEAAGLSRD